MRKKTLSRLGFDLAELINEKAVSQLFRARSTHPLQNVKICIEIKISCVIYYKT